MGRTFDHEDSTRERTPPGPQARSGRLIAISAIASVGGLLYGFVLSVIAGAEPLLRDQFSLGAGLSGFVVGNLDLGAAAGALIAGPLADRLGRRPLIALVAAAFGLSGILSATAPDVAWLVVGRLAGGLAVGATVVVPMYVAEISPAARRGFLVSLVQLGIVTGILAAYVVGWALVGSGPDAWRWMFAAGIAPAAFLLAAAPALPESPRWLVARGRDDRARATLARFAPADAEAELAEIRASLASEEGRWAAVLRRDSRRPLSIGLAVALLSVTVGINAVILYGPAILVRGAGDTLEAALFGSILIGAVNLVFSVLAMASVDRIGRKPLLLIGLSGMLASMMVLGQTFGRGDRFPVLASILVYVAFYAVSLGPVTWILISEIFPTRIRGLAASTCVVAMYLADFAVTFAFPSMMEALGDLGFHVFAAVCGLGLVFVACWVPETKGRSLERIEAIWTRRGEARSSGARKERETCG